MSSVDYFTFSSSVLDGIREQLYAKSSGIHAFSKLYIVKETRRHVATIYYKIPRPLHIGFAHSSKMYPGREFIVIAKINNRYRTLCAVHHPCSIDVTAIRRCLCVLKILSAPENRLLVKVELLLGSKFDNNFWVGK